MQDIAKHVGGAVVSWLVRLYWGGGGGGGGGPGLSPGRAIIIQSIANFSYSLQLLSM